MQATGKKSEEMQASRDNSAEYQAKSENAEDICEGKQTQTRTEIVRLPGVANDISRRLGFEIIQEPYLFMDQQTQLLHASYKGDIVLKGGRLWRSTQVTLGSQKADRIIVLPNMEGILAHFDCVQPQLGWGATAATSTAPRSMDVQAAAQQAIQDAAALGPFSIPVLCGPAKAWLGRPTQTSFRSRFPTIFGF